MTRCSRLRRRRLWRRAAKFRGDSALYFGQKKKETRRQIQRNVEQCVAAVMRPGESAQEVLLLKLTGAAFQIMGDLVCRFILNERAKSIDNFAVINRLQHVVSQLTPSASTEQREHKTNVGEQYLSRPFAVTLESIGLLQTHHIWIIHQVQRQSMKLARLHQTPVQRLILLVFLYDFELQRVRLFTQMQRVYTLAIHMLITGLAFDQTKTQ